ncbi:MAG: histidine phosphatase family protein [Gemmatimonadales bacterium]
MTRLYLVRHGATPLSTEDRFSGADGVDLSEAGRFQCAQLGTRLAGDGITAVYASNYSRAIESARIICKSLGSVPAIDEGLREISHGHWEGMARRDVETRFPDEYASWEEDPFTFAPEGGESGVSVLARALPVIRTIVKKHEDERVLVVSHKATIRIILSSLLGFDVRGYRDRLDQAPACLNVLDFKDPVRVRLMLFNDVSHYADRARASASNLSRWWDPPPTAS